MNDLIENAGPLAYESLTLLYRSFPLHVWGVDVQIENGIMHVWEQNLSPDDMRYVLHLNKLDWPGLRRVRQAGGEILERHGVI